MADQIFNVDSGFYNAVDGDRTYYAEDMIKPYNRLISDGVFSNSDGSSSDDLEVTSASGAMDIQVAEGQAMIGSKWFQNTAVITITVPSNPASYPRFDSVILQVDNTLSSRVGSVIYRTGTAASNPALPSLVNNDSIIEYRLANIYVASNANAINNDAITDLRGTSSCPWVESIIQQVGTTISSSDIDEIVDSIS